MNNKKALVVAVTIGLFLTPSIVNAQIKVEGKLDTEEVIFGKKPGSGSGSGGKVAVDRSSSSTCGSDFRKNLEKKMENMVKNVCDSPAINTETTTDGPNGEDNIFIYVNPEQGCDLGFEMPGFPSIGGSLSLDSCKALKSVTGGMVRKANEITQGALDESIGAIIDKVDEKTPGDGFDYDLNDAAVNGF